MSPAPWGIPAIEAAILRPPTTTIIARRSQDHSPNSSSPGYHPGLTLAVGMIPAAPSLHPSSCPFPDHDFRPAVHGKIHLHLIPGINSPKRSVALSPASDNYVIEQHMNRRVINTTSFSSQATQQLSRCELICPRFSDNPLGYGNSNRKRRAQYHPA